MKRIITLSILLSMALTKIANARIVSGEYVQKQEVIDWYASMSEALRNFTSLDTITSKVEKNPTAKKIHDLAEAKGS